MDSHSPQSIEILATACFALALVHTFCAGRLRRCAGHLRRGKRGDPLDTAASKLIHLLTEVEIIFGAWAILFLALATLSTQSWQTVVRAGHLDFTEPLFVFVIMAMAATAPILALSKKLVFGFARLMPGGSNGYSRYFSCLFIGPLLGSLITEPAAMTVTALILRDQYLSRGGSAKFKYLTLAILFVNISIGGVMTPFAAPPVLMVASTWSWDLMFMAKHFAWRALIATAINAFAGTLLLRRELKSTTVQKNQASDRDQRIPAGLILANVAFLGSTVAVAHQPILFLAIFTLFLTFVALTRRYQDQPQLRQGLFVSIFLSGLVVLGAYQKWWLHSTLLHLSGHSIFVGSILLTSIVDNAALTYLGAQIAGLSDLVKYGLVSGAVVGGGLTVIANAPNPAGQSILRDVFGPRGIEPGRLLLAALIPTLIAAICFWPYGS